MEVDEKSKTCPVCGYEFPSPFKLQWIALLLLVLFLLILFYRLI